MQAGTAFVYEKKCAWCGKRFGVLHTDLWAYKRGEKYFCSWKCLRANDKAKEGNSLRKITLEDKKKAVEIAIGGGDPREFLKKKCLDPTQAWNRIRNSVKDSDPETYAKLPKSIKGSRKEPETPEGTLGDAMQGMQDAADKFFGACKDMGLKVETPEAPVSIPEPPKERYQCTGLAVSELGEFYNDRKFGCVDWRTDEGEEVSMDAAHWMILAKEIPIILQKVGAWA